MYIKSPTRKWRYEPGDLIKISFGHHVWSDYIVSNGLAENTSCRLETNDCVIFIEAYGFEYNGNNWKRSEWNLKVLSPKYGIVWVCNEYTEHCD